MTESCDDKEILKRLRNWWIGNKRDFPWRKHDITPYESLIAEIMLQKTRAVKVQRVFPKFMKKYPTPQELSSASIKEIKETIYHLGLLRRARQLKKLGDMIMGEFGGVVPREKSQLKRLHGVGEYIASAVRTLSMGMDDPLVDANTTRIAQRIWGVGGQEEVADKLRQLVSPNNCRDDYFMLMDFGALVCKAVGPDHLNCPVNECCFFYQRKGRPR